jgi:hypothetical protein
MQTVRLLAPLGRLSAFYGMGFAILSVIGWRETTTTSGLSVTAQIAGFFIWTLGYYATHRWLLHRSNSPRWLQGFTEHLYHHRVPSDPDEWEFTIRETFPLCLGAETILWLLTDKATASLLMSGILLGYLAYEWVHQCAHIPDLNRGRLMRLITRNHLQHHVHSNRCFGTVLPIWAFGHHFGG